jgi:hypothetical protein
MAIKFLSMDFGRAVQLLALPSLSPPRGLLETNGLRQKGQQRLCQRNRDIVFAVIPSGFPISFSI